MICRDIWNKTLALTAMSESSQKGLTQARFCNLLDSAVEALSELGRLYCPEQTKIDYSLPLTLDSDFPLPDCFATAAAARVGSLISEKPEQLERLYLSETERIRSMIPADVAPIVEVI